MGEQMEKLPKVTIRPYQPKDSWYSADEIDSEDNESVAAYLKALAKFIRRNPLYMLDAISLRDAVAYAYFSGLMPEEE